MASLIEQIDRVPVESLTLHPQNARRGDVKAIAASLRVNEQFSPIVVQTSTRYVLSGNHTLMAARELGWQEIDAVFVDVDDDRAYRIMLAANRTADLGGYDNDALAELLSYLDGDFEGTGYSQADVDFLLDYPESEQDEDDVPAGPPPADPVTKPGDVWILGPHRLMCGDSTNPDDLTKLVDDRQPNLIYTDPPYGVAIVNKAGKVGDTTGYPFGGVKNGKQGSKGTVRTTEYLPVAGDDTTDVATDAFRLLMAEYPEARHVWWGGNHYAASASLPDSACWLIWDKETNGDFADAELAWTNHTGAVRLLRHMWNGMLRASERGKRVHPTQKPVALAEWAFSVVDPEHTRETVLDVFGGSGSTLLACHTTGRVGLLMEMEPAYNDVIARRFQQTTGIRPILAATGEEHDFTTEPANQ